MNTYYQKASRSGCLFRMLLLAVMIGIAVSSVFIMFDLQKLPTISPTPTIEHVPSTLVAAPSPTILVHMTTTSTPVPVIPAIPSRTTLPDESATYHAATSAAALMTLVVPTPVGGRLDYRYKKELQVGESSFVDVVIDLSGIPESQDLTSPEVIARAITGIDPDTTQHGFGDMRVRIFPFMSVSLCGSDGLGLDDNCNAKVWRPVDYHGTTTWRWSITGKSVAPDHKVGIEICGKQDADSPDELVVCLGNIEVGIAVREKSFIGRVMDSTAAGAAAILAAALSGLAVAIIGLRSRSDKAIAGLKEQLAEITHRLRLVEVRLEMGDTSDPPRKNGEDPDKPSETGMNPDDEADEAGEPAPPLPDHDALFRRPSGE